MHSMFQINQRCMHSLVATPGSCRQQLPDPPCKQHLGKINCFSRSVKPAALAVQQRSRCFCSRQEEAEQSASTASTVQADLGGAPETDARVAVEGDIVTVHYKCMNAKGQIIETSEATEPLTFEVGAGEVMGNKMFQAFDAGVRGLQIGDKTYLEASGGEWNKDLLFKVPCEHAEVQRLEGRYKNVGGLKEGLVVELANGSNAMVLDVKDGFVQLDANNMMAGQTLMFELKLVSIDFGKSASNQD